MSHPYVGKISLVQYSFPLVEYNVERTCEYSNGLRHGSYTFKSLKLQFNNGVLDQHLSDQESQVFLQDTSNIGNDGTFTLYNDLLNIKEKQSENEVLYVSDICTVPLNNDLLTAFIERYGVQSCPITCPASC